MRSRHRTRTDNRLTYVVVSLGADGKLDVPDLAEYFQLAESEIHGQPSRDIVFRDGVAVTLAGK